MVRVGSYGGYHEDEETTFRRYSSRGHGYPLSHDREYNSASNHAVYAGSRNHHPSSNEPRTIERSPESDSNSRPRSRIPVACGRCRKRKIRCSGDTGTGEPCTNCKNAGNEQCQFLRVSSEPAQMKNECASGYDYNASGGAAASRLNCRMVPFAPQFGTHSAPLPLDGYQYRNGSMSTYQYPVKPYYQMPSFGDYGDENVDYGLQGQLIGTDQMGLAPNYITSTSARGWTPAPQIPKTPLYIEQSETPYSHGQVQMPFHHASSYPLRTQMNSDPKNMPMNGMGASLPPPLNASVDRMLPFPAGNTGRPAQMGSFLRSSDNLPSATTLQSQHFNDYSFVRNDRNPNNNNASSESASVSSSSYLPASSTSPESLSPSSHMAYAPQPPSSSGHHSSDSDIYSPPSQDNMSAGSESSYAHNRGSDGSKRDSQGSQGSNGDGSLPSMNDQQDLLVNGHKYHYVPMLGYSGQNNYGPVPPIIHHPTPVSRHSIAVGADHE
ncbi:hypothetical protein QTJ16_005082 [Diplocarpon rosae]|uniref:Zn(2)-C6 fungal-type domain-containing protein n=1 Tax=Diplocarpon rosae TaxID=946125 RepID=A0AAD9WBX3_9HELO|nr:hypothetical protein QTJ16_005082 [Diplocarpon rosae]PBP20133.1 hemagglutinin protein [Diplocarpon rosae]